MPEAKIVGRARARRSKATVTAALMVEPGAVLPKGAAAFTFTAPPAAVKMFQGRATKIKALLQGYGDAVARSHKAGHAVSFRVEVAPDGAATVTALDSEATPVDAAAAMSFPVEEVATRSLELEAALQAARDRGQLQAAEILRGSDMLSADAFAEKLGTTRVTVNAKRQSGQLLGLEGAKRGFRFPVWQLDANGRPYPELPALLERLGAPWAVYRFLVQRQGALNGRTGRQALEKGDGANVLAAAEGIARGDFT